MSDYFIPPEWEDALVDHVARDMRDLLGVARGEFAHDAELSDEWRQLARAWMQSQMDKSAEELAEDDGTA